jgi:hypothetical protein
MPYWRTKKLRRKPFFKAWPSCRLDLICLLVSTQHKQHKLIIKSIRYIILTFNNSDVNKINASRLNTIVANHDLLFHSFVEWNNNPWFGQWLDTSYGFHELDTQKISWHWMNVLVFRSLKLRIKLQSTVFNLNRKLQKWGLEINFLNSWLNHTEFWAN